MAELFWASTVREPPLYASDPAIWAVTVLVTTLAPIRADTAALPEAATPMARDRIVD